jgi:aminopeptidase N
MAPAPGSIASALLASLLLQEAAPPLPADVVAAARKIAAIEASDHPIPPRSVAVGHYLLRIAIDLASHSVEGSAELTLHPFGAARRTLELDADELSIKSVVALAGGAGGGKPLAHESKGTTLSIDLGREVAPDEELTLKIDYSAKPRRGLVFVDAPAAMCWSQGECEMNRAWFPCRDFPDDRATSELFVTVADGLRTVSNGMLVETKPADGGRHTDHWKFDLPHPAYLTSVAVGPFVEADLGKVRDVPLLAYSTAERRDAIAAALQPTGRMVELLEELAGAPYPWPVYRQVAVADFPYDGMENVAATTLSQDDLPALDQLAEKRDEADAIVVHELCHQWFGDLVSATSWADIWLSEGFATFAEPWWLEKSRGVEAAAAAWATRQAKAVGHRLEERRPVVCDRYVEPDDLFDPTVYEYAGCFLNLLRHAVGDEKFFAASRAWIERERGRSVATADFETLFTGVCGKECAPLFAEWLHGSGVPVVEFSWQFDADRRQLLLTAEQKQSGPLVPEVFHVPLDVAWIADGARRTTRFQLDARTAKATIPCDVKPAFVRFNDGGGLFGVLATKQEPAAWREALANDPDAGGRAEAAAALASAWPASDADDAAKVERRLTLAALAKSLLEEKAAAVRAAAAAALGETKHEVARTALCTALWDEEAEVRTAAAAALGRFAGDEVARGALFRRFSTESRIDVRAECVRQLAVVGADDIAAQLEQLADNERAPPALRGAALTGLATPALYEKLGEPVRGRVVERAGRLAKLSPSRDLRRSAIEALGTLAKKSDAAADALVALLDEPSLWAKATVLAALDEAANARTLAGLVRFHEKAAFPDQRSKARQIVAKLVAALPP